MNKSNVIEYGSEKYHRRMMNGYYVLSPIVNGVVDYAHYVYEHRFLYEMYHGTKLSGDIHIHHINHDRSDNSPENLVAMTPSEHAIMHHAENGDHVGLCHCAECGREISSKATICVDCYRKKLKSKVKPPKDVLSKLIETMSNRAIGRLYGVSDTAVKKWRASYGLPKASARYA